MSLKLRTIVATMRTGNWSSPFFGVQHLAGLKRGFQVTVTNWDSFAECCVWTPGCGFGAVETKHDTIEQAREYGEQQARALNAQSEAA